MKATLFFTIFSAIVITCSAQSFKAGAISTASVSAKFDGEITISDSTVVFKSMGQSTKVKVINRTDANTLYVTDGTATDKITISVYPGKISGFKYTHAIVVDKDKRFSSDQLIYFCTKRD